jgi:hypothetical protein
MPRWLRPQLSQAAEIVSRWRNILFAPDRDFGLLHPQSKWMQADRLSPELYSSSVVAIVA